MEAPLSFDILNFEGFGAATDQFVSTTFPIYAALDVFRPDAMLSAGSCTGVVGLTNELKPTPFCPRAGTNRRCWHSQPYRWVL